MVKYWSYLLCTPVTPGLSTCQAPMGPLALPQGPCYGISLGLPHGVPFASQAPRVPTCNHNPSSIWHSGLCSPKQTLIHHQALLSLTATLGCWAFAIRSPSVRPRASVCFILGSTVSGTGRARSCLFWIGLLGFWGLLVGQGGAGFAYIPPKRKGGGEEQEAGGWRRRSEAKRGEDGTRDLPLACMQLRSSTDTWFGKQVVMESWGSCPYSGGLVGRQHITLQ